MNFQNSLNQLEHAAKILLESPACVTKEDRKSAETILMSFRNTRNALDLCSFILDNSHSELVLFETVEVIKNNYVQNHDSISPEIINHIQNKILNILMTRSLSYGLSMKLSSVISLIVKHQGLKSEGKERSELVDYFINLSSQPNQNLVSNFAQTIPFCVFDTLLAEHQYTVKSDDYSLSFEQHGLLKKQFENRDLLMIFRFCLKYLNEFDPDATNFRNFSQILELLENIFHWSFAKSLLMDSTLSRKSIARVVEMSASPFFRPPASWKGTVDLPDFIPSIFNIYMKCRKDEAMLTRCLNIITQLECFKLGNVINQQTGPLMMIMSYVINLISLQDKSPTETLRLTKIVKAVLMHFPALEDWLSSKGESATKFFDAIGNLGREILQKVAIEEGQRDVDDRVYREAATRFLEVLSELELDGDSERVKSFIIEHFDLYLRAHLSAPDGFRQPTADNAEDDDDETDAKEFTEQLQAIGSLGRKVPSHSLPILSRLLNAKCQKLQNQIQIVANGNASRDTLVPIYEDLHWVILIAGHVLACNPDEGIGFVFHEISANSQALEYNVQASEKAFVESFNLKVPADDDATLDPVVKLVCSVVAISETERRCVQSGLGSLLSPELTANILWFLGRFCASYLTLEAEDLGEVIPPVFKRLWSNRTEVSRMTQNLFMRRVKEDIVRHNGDTEVLREAVDLLFCLINTKDRAECALQCSELSTINELASQIGPGKFQMPRDLYMKFIRTVVYVGSFSDNKENMMKYWDMVLQPLQQRFAVLSNLNDAEKHKNEVRLELASVLSGFIGAAMSVNSKTATALYYKIKPIVAQCGNILNVYHNYVEVIELCLQLVTEVASLTLSYLPKKEAVTLYEAGMLLVKAYSAHATGRLSLEKTAEEDTYSDLMMLLDMLFALLHRDYLDLSLDEDNNFNGSIGSVDVAMCGLTTILPLMNAQLLQYPNLNVRYFKLLEAVSVLFADNVLNSPPPVFQGFMESVNICLHSSTCDAFYSACACVRSLAEHIARHKLQQTASGQAIRPFLKVILELIISQNCTRSSVPSIAGPLIALISAFQDTYQELVNQLVCSCKTEHDANKLRQAFVKLTEKLKLDDAGNKLDRIVFRGRLEHFIFTAVGCIDV